MSEPTEQFAARMKDISSEFQRRNKFDDELTKLMTIGTTRFLEAKLTGNKEFVVVFLKELDQLGEKYQDVKDVWNSILDVKIQILEAMAENKVDKEPLESKTRINKNRVSSFLRRVIHNYPESKEIDWVGIWKTPNLTEDFILEFIQKYPDKIAWADLCSNPSLTEDLIRELLRDYPEKIEWVQLCKNPSLTEKLIRDLFQNHLDKIEWSSLCINPSLTEPIIREILQNHLKKIDLDTLCWNPNLNDSLIQELFRNHLDEIDWYGLCCNPSLSEAIFDILVSKYPDEIDWEALCRNKLD